MATNDYNEFDYLELYDHATGGVEEAYPVYEFGGGRKVFMSNYQGEGVYGKPFPYAADPDLAPNTNP